MALTQRERLIHVLTVIGIMGPIEHVPADVTRELAEAMRYERCRRLTDCEVDEIVCELEEEKLACVSAMAYITDELGLSQAHGGQRD